MIYASDVCYFCSNSRPVRDINVSRTLGKHFICSGYYTVVDKIYCVNKIVIT